MSAKNLPWMTRDILARKAEKERAAAEQLDPVIAYKYEDGAGGYGHFCPKCAESTRKQLPPSMRDDGALRASDFEFHDDVSCETCGCLIFGFKLPSTGVFI